MAVRKKKTPTKRKSKAKAPDAALVKFCDWLQADIEHVVQQLDPDISVRYLVETAMCPPKESGPAGAYSVVCEATCREVRFHHLGMVCTRGLIKNYKTTAAETAIKELKNIVRDYMSSTLYHEVALAVAGKQLSRWFADVPDRMTTAPPTPSKE